MGFCICVNLRLKVRFSLDQKDSNTILEWPERHGMLHWCEFDRKYGFLLTRSTQIPYWNGPRDMECCIGVNSGLKVRFSLDQKHSNTILEWPERHGMLHWCEFAIESTVFS